MTNKNAFSCYFGRRPIANPVKDKARMQETIKFFENSNERPVGSSALRIQRLQDSGLIQLRFLFKIRVWENDSLHEDEFLCKQGNGLFSWQGFADCSQPI